MQCHLVLFLAVSCCTSVKARLDGQQDVFLDLGTFTGVTAEIYLSVSSVMLTAMQQYLLILGSFYQGVMLYPLAVPSSTSNFKVSLSCKNNTYRGYTVRINCLNW